MMHELSIATSVIDIVSSHVANHRSGRSGAVRVTRVELKIGHLRQVVPSALAFSFELAAQGTPVEGAELAMEMVPAVGWCRECGAESELQTFPLQCGACGGFDLEIVAGEELIVESLELEEIDSGAYSH